MSRFRYHVFSCQNDRPAGSRPACAARGAGAVLAALRARLLSGPLCDEAQVTPSGCLGLCFDGPVLVVYPEGVWYANVTPADVGEIVAGHLVAGRPVARLRYRWPPSEPESA